MLTAGDVTHGVGRLTAIIIILLVLVDALTMLASAFQVLAGMARVMRSSWQKPTTIRK